MRLALATLLALCACADTDGSAVLIRPPTNRLLISIIDRGEPIDCANARNGQRLELLAVDGDSERVLPFSGCEEGTVAVTRPDADGLRLQVLTDDATWSAAPGEVQLTDDDVYEFDITSQATKY